VRPIKLKRALDSSPVCARTTLSKKDLREVAEELEAEFSEEDALTFRPRYNAAPSETLWILRPGADRRVIAPAVWGYRAKARTLINVRRESVGAGRGLGQEGSTSYLSMWLCARTLPVAPGKTTKPSHTKAILRNRISCFIVRALRPGQVLKRAQPSSPRACWSWARALAMS
jgi:hypothetical protein